MATCERLKAYDYQMAGIERTLRDSLELCSSVHKEEILDTVLDQVMEVLEAEAGILWLKEEDGCLFPLAVRGTFALRMRSMRLPPGEGVAGRVTETGECLLVKDVARDRRWAICLEQITGLPAKSLLCVPLVVHDRVMGCLEMVNRCGGGVFTERDLLSCSTLASHVAPVMVNHCLFSDKIGLSASMIHTLASSLDAGDRYTSGHSVRVSECCLRMAPYLGLTPKEIEVLRKASLLHDIGKIAINDKVLLAKNNLSSTAWSVMKRHPEIGARIVMQVEVPHLVKDVSSAILHHHERYDGRGYPMALSGRAIPLMGRVIALGDAFDAITSDRPYRAGVSAEVALDEIRLNAGTQFDPDLARVFCRMIEETDQRVSPSDSPRSFAEKA